ncbi:hypothetical protein FO519_004707 [Halicephalobus sp. NKZ332]|nr:hypothetical protein FO519_004707 [Halicephalobus sp. NKZ332]
MYHNLMNVSWKQQEKSEKVELIFIDYEFSHEIPEKVCSLIESSAKNGDIVVTLLGASSQPGAMVSESYAREIDLPFISMVSVPDPRLQIYRTRKDGFLPERSLDLWTSGTHFGDVISKILDEQKSSKILVVYSNSEDLVSIQGFLKNSFKPFSQRKSFFRIYMESEDNRSLIKEAIVNLQVTTFILHLSLSRIKSFLSQAEELGICESETNFILTNMDSIVDDIHFFETGYCRISSLSFVDIESPAVRKLTNFMKNNQKEVLPEIGLETKTAIWSDSVAVLASGINRSEVLKSGKIKIQKEPSCKRLPLFVRDFRSFLVKTKLEGTTGKMNFDENGKRKNFEFFIYEMRQKSTWTKTSLWSENNLISFSPKQKETDSKDTRLHLKVTVYLEEPFVMIKSNMETLNLTGNEIYEGYCIDLLEKIAQLRNFTYEIHEVKDKTYGVKEPSGRWTGMVGELQSGVADLAVASLTVTYTRSEVLDFTVPFMHLGISILFKKPETATPGLFRFMSPLSYEVWLWALGAYLGASVSIWILAKLSPKEIQKEDQNKLTFSNSLWFTVSSLMQQGPEICPTSISTRIATVFWWFFALIFISSYTANLAAFLTTERMITPIENADDLAKQTKIKYGTLGRGSTMTFFNESKIETYEKMWKLMESQPSLFVKSSKEGIQRVKTSDYAYLMESSMLEYAIERDCELLQIGGLLDQKGYAIGLPKGSPHRKLISTAILELQEKTVLTELKDKWWKKQRGGGLCQQSKVTPNEYGSKSVGGIFIVLKMIKISWNEQRGKENKLKMTIDELIEYKNGLPVPQYSNPAVSDTL